MPASLDDSIQFLKHVGPARVEDFARLGVGNVRELILTFPRYLSDRSQTRTIADAPANQPVTIAASAVSVDASEIKTN